MATKCVEVSFRQIGDRAEVINKKLEEIESKGGTLMHIDMQGHTAVLVVKYPDVQSADLNLPAGGLPIIGGPAVTENLETMTPGALQTREPLESMPTRQKSKKK